MRPTTPSFNVTQRPGQEPGPSSPPQTPVSPSFPYRQYKTRRNGMYFTAPSTDNAIGIDIPSNQKQAQSPFYNQPSELSPRSSSPTSSTHSSDLSSSPPPPRSLSSSPGAPISTSAPLTKARIIAETKANFTIEEFGASDYEEFDSDVDSIIRPTQYEDAESDRGHSATVQAQQLDSEILSDLQNLNCENSDDDAYYAREAFLQFQREEKRRKRRSSSSFKRTLAQSIGSDTDDEDLIPGLLDANDAGSSARRLRRKTGERMSLIFDDPPPRIDECEEPESCEEIVVMGDDEEQDGLASLPYWIQEDMELDSTSEEEEDSDEDSDDDDE